MVENRNEIGLRSKMHINPEIPGTISGHNYRGRCYPVGEDIAPATLRNDKSETLLLVPVLNLANGFAS